MNDKEFIFYSKKNKKYLKKIYTNNSIDKLKNEILGYKYSNKKNYFNTPKLISYELNKKQKNINIEFIKGEKPSIFEIKKVFKKKNIETKKVTILKYINFLKKKYKKDKFFYTIKKKYSLTNISKINIYTSYAHGDLANYNCLKYKNKIYVFDFEKFGERIFVYDFFNWYFHPIISKISKYIYSCKFKIIANFVISSIINILSDFVIRIIFKNQIFKTKLDYKKFNIYFFLYLIEKFLILRGDISYLKNSKNKKIAKMHLIILRLLISKTYNEIIK